jgi:hypothetical protein
VVELVHRLGTAEEDDRIRVPDARGDRHDLAVEVLGAAIRGPPGHGPGLGRGPVRQIDDGATGEGVTGGFEDLAGGGVALHADDHQRARGDGVADVRSESCALGNEGSAFSRVRFHTVVACPPSRNPPAIAEPISPRPRTVTDPASLLPEFELTLFPFCDSP